MGRIVQIHLFNFKSYGGNHVIDFPSDFTAVIGPNGSGKSNLMDAISFVLGVESKKLRGREMSSLIYRKNSESADVPNEREGYVEISYKNDDNDITKFKRRVLPTGTTRYLIDDKNVKWDEYNKFLKSIGIFVRTRNFLVFQGDVESIASKSPKDLTLLIEQISGSADLIPEYNRYKEDAENAEEVFLQTIEKKRTIAKEKKQIKEQKDEAEDFQFLLEQHHNKIVEFFLWQLFHVEKDINEHRIAMKSMNDELNIKTNELSTLEKELSEKGQIKGTSERKRVQLNQKINKLMKTIEKTKPEHIQLETSIQHSEKIISDSIIELEEAKKIQDDHTNEIKKLKEHLEVAQDKQNKFLSELSIENDENKRLKLAENQLREYNDIKERVSSETSLLHVDLNKLTREYRLHEERESGVKEEIQTLMNSKNNIDSELKKVNNNIKLIDERINNTKNDYNNAENNIISLKETIKVKDIEKKELSLELKEIHHRILEARAESRESERQIRMDDALESLKARFPGKVLGRIVDLCKVTQRKYHLPVTVALGNNMDAIVTDDEKTAIECIQYLREQRIGTSRFIPLDTIKSNPVNERYRTLGNNFTLVIDAIEADITIQPALAYACGDTLIANSIDEARELAYNSTSDDDFTYKYRIVTLDGTMIHKTGNLTGGVGKFKKQANQWNDKDVARLKQRKVVLYKQILDLSQKLNDDEERKYKADMDTCNNRLEYLSIEKNELVKKVDELNNKIMIINDLLADKNNDYNRYHTLTLSKQSNIDAIKKNIDQIEDEYFDDFSKQVGVTCIREYEEQRLKSIQKHMTMKVTLSNEVSSLQTKLQYELARNMSSSVMVLEKKISNEKKTLKKLQNNESAVRKQLELQKNNLEELTNELNILQNDMELIKLQFKELKSKGTIILKDMQHIDTLLTVREGEIEQYRNIKREVFRTCKVQQIVLPVKDNNNSTSDDDDDNINSRGKRTKRDTSTKTGSKKKRKKTDNDNNNNNNNDDDDDDDNNNDDNIILNFDSLTHYLDIKTKQEYEQIKANYVHEMSLMQSELEKLAPNLKAIEAFVNINEKLQNSHNVWEENKEASKRATETFISIQTERHNKFMKAFEHISSEISKIYSQLTTSQGFPNGGKAYLDLESSEEPYLQGVKFTAMPPMKRFRAMDQLSGGEKTVAALALLFAIHSYHPAPFFVLDEIDAALDNVNVSHVSNFIREKAKTQGLQCIVISLKDTFYIKADGLVGIYRDNETESSGNITLDLQKYESSD